MYMAALTAVKTTLELSFFRYSFLPTERAAPTSHTSRETVAAWLQGHRITTITPPPDLSLCCPGMNRR